VTRAPLDRLACLSLLATQSLGRLIFTFRALPDVLPVRYRLEGENVLILVDVSSPAAAASLDSVVAFEVDHFDEHCVTGWSVTIVGQARKVAQQSGGGPTGAALTSWAADGRDLFLKVAAERITGRHLNATPDQPSA
jgi:uncharacterized protein